MFVTLRQKIKYALKPLEAFGGNVCLGAYWVISMQHSTKKKSSIHSSVTTLCLGLSTPMILGDMLSGVLAPGGLQRQTGLRGVVELRAI